MQWYNASKFQSEILALLSRFLMNIISLDFSVTSHNYFRFWNSVQIWHTINILLQLKSILSIFKLSKGIFMLPKRQVRTNIRALSAQTPLLQNRWHSFSHRGRQQRLLWLWHVSCPHALHSECKLLLSSRSPSTFLSGAARLKSLLHERTSLSERWKTEGQKQQVQPQLTNWRAAERGAQLSKSL